MMRASTAKAAIIVAALVLPLGTAGAAPALAAPELARQASAQQSAASARTAVAAASVRVLGRVAAEQQAEPRDRQQRIRRHQATRTEADRGLRATRTEADRGVRAAVAPNPTMAETCGIDATLTLDSSGSIGSSASQVRTAAQEFLLALKDTNSTLRIASFSDRAKQLAPRSPVNAATTGPGGVLANGVKNYPSPDGGTNWMEGLDLTNSGDSQQPELLLFVTDGDPTRWTDPDGRLRGSGLVEQPNINNSLARAIPAADRVKGKNTRILVVGVGNALNNSASQGRLKDISGPQLVTSPAALVGKSINQVDAVAFTNFAALSTFLRSVVTSLCGNSVTVQKLAQSAGDTQHLPATGWNMTVKPTVSGGVNWVQPDTAPAESKTVATSGAQGSALFQWRPNNPSAPANVTITEAVKDGFNANRWECDLKKPDGSTTTLTGNLTTANPSFSFAMASQDVAACRLINDFQYRPDMAVTKTPRDDPVRGNNGGWDEIYDIVVTNTGNSPLTIAKPIDEKCSAIVGPTNSGGASRLAPGASWNYTCASHIEAPTTSQPVVQRNVVTVTGVPPGGAPVVRTATASVDVRTPAIALVKTARKADGTPIGDDPVPAGTRVVYVYTVTNPGNDTLRNLAATDDRCAPLVLVSGDVNNDGRLQPGETWVYNCTTVLNPPRTQSSVTNTGTVTADWSNPQNRSQNNAKVTSCDRKTIKVIQSASLSLVKLTNPGAADHNFGFTVAGQGVPGPDQAFSLNARTDPSRKIELDAPAPGGSTYTVTEGADAAWDVTDISCSKAATVDLAARTLSVVIQPAEDVTCTYTNSRRPNLTISKETAPAGAAETFGFTASRPALLPLPDPVAFDLSDGQNQEYTAIAPGQITITEDDIPAGWRLDQISCGPHPVVVTGDAATLDLAYGDDVDCTFSNAALPAASLTVTKSGTTSAASPLFPFTVSGTGLVNPGQPGSDSFNLAVSESKSYDVRPGESGNVYTIEEQSLPPPGPGESAWDLTSIECVLDSDPGNPIVGDVATGVVEVPLVPGDGATCTYTDQRRPSLEIAKQVVVGQGQTGAATRFNFATTGLTPPTFDLGNDDAQAFGNLPDGTAVSVTETPIDDWSLTILQCAGSGSDAITVDPGTRRISGTLTYGDDVTCLYVNTKDPSDPALLTVVKQVDPTIDAPVFSYNFSSIPADPNVENFTLDPNPSGTDSRTFTLAPVDLGTDYTITEQVRSGWANAELSCEGNGSPGTVTDRTVTLRLAPGDEATCTYTNQREGRLTIVKQESVGQGQIGGLTWGFNASGVTPTSFSLQHNETRTFADIPVGTAVTITEQAPDPDVWDTTITCTGRGAGHYTTTGRQLSGTVQNTDDVTCLYTNTRQPLEKAVLTVSKAVAPPEPGATFDYDFASDNGDPEAQDFSLTTGADGTDARVFTLTPFEPFTTYTLSEQASGGYDFADLSCTVNQAPVPVTGADVALALSPGDTATCHYENTRKAQLTIAKEVVVGTGQSGADRRFDFVTTNLTPGTFTLGNEQTQGFTSLTTGEQVAVDEPAAAGWQTHVTCAGLGANRFMVTGGNVTGTPQAGDDVTCSYTNRKDPLRPALFGVVKFTDPSDSPVTFDFTAEGTGLFVVDQPGQDSFQLTDGHLKPYLVHPVEAGNDYTVTETLKPGWDLVDLLCFRSDDIADPIEGDLDTGSVTVPSLLPGQSAICGFSNQQRGSLTITKETDAPTQTRFPFTAVGVTPDSFDLAADESRSFADLEPGTVATITEAVPSDPGDRWDLQDIICSGSAVPPVVDLAAGRVTVTVGAGEDVECVYADAQVPTATVQVVKAADPADGTSFAFSAAGSAGGVLPPDQAFSLAPDGDVAVKTLVVHPAKDGETVTIAEDIAALPDWHLLEIVCELGGQPIGLVTGSQVDLPVQPGDTIGCTFSNRRDATLTVRKAAPDDPSVPFPFSWRPGFVPADFSLADDGSDTRTGLEPGAYTVAELVDDPAFPVDWLLSNSAGQPFGECVGTTGIVDGPDPGSTALTIAAGEDVVCTFANFFDYRPAITLTKTADRTVLLQGGTVAYGYVLTNAGNTPIPYTGDKDDVVTDDICAPVTYVGSSGPDDDQLDPGEEWTFTCRSGALNTSTRNVGTATLPNPVDPDERLVATDDEFVEVLVPGLELDKTAGAETVYPGTEVGYTYVLRNVGQTPFEGPADRSAWVVDDTCSAARYVSGDTDDDSVLDVGEFWSFACTATLNATTRNTATGTGIPFVPASPQSGAKQTGPPLQASDVHTVAVVVRDITIAKSASSPGGIVRDGVLLFPSGQDVTYNYDVTAGRATTPMQVVAVVDTDCSPVTFVSGDINGNGKLDPGETWRYECKLTVTGAQRIRNTVTVVAVEPILGESSNATAQATVESFTSGIEVRKRPDRDLVPEGRTVTYTYEVDSSGTSPLSEIGVTDDRCSPVTYRSGDVNNDRILQPDETWIYTCATTITATVTNVAVATGRNLLGVQVTATSSARVTLLTPQSLDALIRVAKVPSQAKVTKGGAVTYTYSVTNPGRVPLADVKKLITDDRCAPVGYVRGDVDRNNLLTSGKGLGEYPKETWIFTCAHKLRATTTNTVRVGGLPYYDGEVVGPRVNASATAKVTVASKKKHDNKHKKHHKKRRDNNDSNHHGDNPSFTGADVLRMLALALAALAAGILLVLYARRRRSP